MAIPVALIASAVTALGSQIFSQLKKRRAEKYNEAQADKAYERSLPITQKQNLIDAGLNPNLVYSNVNPASYQAQQTEPSSGDPLQSSVASYFAIKEQQDGLAMRALQRRTQELQNEYLEQTLPERVEERRLKNTLSIQQAAYYKAQTELAEIKKGLTNAQKDKLDTEINKLLKEIEILGKRGDLLEAQKKALEAENDLNLQLKKYGITAKDPYWLRWLVMYCFPWLFDKPRETPTDPSSPDVQRRIEHNNTASDTNLLLNGGLPPSQDYPWRLTR